MIHCLNVHVLLSLGRWSINVQQMYKMMCIIFQQSKKYHMLILLILLIRLIRLNRSRSVRQSASNTDRKNTAEFNLPSDLIDIKDSDWQIRSAHQCEIDPSTSESSLSSDGIISYKSLNLATDFTQFLLSECLIGRSGCCLLERLEEEGGYGKTVSVCFTDALVINYYVTEPPGKSFFLHCYYKWTCRDLKLAADGCNKPSHSSFTQLFISCWTEMK